LKETIEKVKQDLEKEENLSPSLVASINSIFDETQLLLNKLELNSKNSSKPPSSDPNRKKKKKNGKGKKSQGGQNGHKGTTLAIDEDETPDEIEEIEIDLKKLPPEGNYTFSRWEKRRVISIKITRHIKEYHVAVFVDENGNEFKADFPKNVKSHIQYGPSVKSNAVYMSMFQLVPYKRLEELFKTQFNIPLSAGSLFSFNKEAMEKLSSFEQIVKHKLAISPLIHVDETGINICSKGHWIHSASNENWIWIFPHEKRGKEAMDEIGILPNFLGVMVHDHWKPYFKYDKCVHSLCNAHLLRELTRSFEQDGMNWANKMISFLENLNKEVNDRDGILDENSAKDRLKEYEKILDDGELECPLPEKEEEQKKKRGRVARSKSRNLLERFLDFEEEILRFMRDKKVPFTNNMAERDIRMTKVHQKISGCFRSKEGADIFCSIRSYISTCKKNNYCVKTALLELFEGKLPKFIQDEIDAFNKKAE